MDSSQPSRQAGQLILAGTTLGDPADIPARSLAALRTADLLIFEEDRPARQFLKAAGVHRDYWKHSEHRDEGALDEVRAKLQAGQTVLYMSDQGMPGVADPGSQLVAIAEALGARVTIIPGPCSITAAVAAAPFPVPDYFYAGFPEREPAKRQQQLQRWNKINTTLVIMDTPYRRDALVTDAIAVFGSQRRAVLALDIAGPDEAFITGALQDLAGYQAGKKLNFVLVVAPST